MSRIPALVNRLYTHLKQTEVSDRKRSIYTGAPVLISDEELQTLEHIHTETQWRTFLSQENIALRLLNRIITQKPPAPSENQPELFSPAELTELFQGHYQRYLNLLNLRGPRTPTLWASNPALPPATLEGRRQNVGLNLMGPTTRWSDYLDPRFWISQKQDELTNTLAYHADLLNAVMRFADILPAIQDDDNKVVERMLEFFPQPDDRLPWYLNLGIRMAHAAKNASEAFPLKKIIAKAAKMGTRQMAMRYIAGENAAEALPRFRKLAHQGMTVIADKLGEAVKSEEEANQYLSDNLAIVNTLASDSEFIQAAQANWEKPTQVNRFAPQHRVHFQLSIKLSSLYSQWNVTDPEGTAKAVKSRLRKLLRNIQLWESEKGVRVGLTIDLEQFAYRDLTYRIFKEVMMEPMFLGMENVGVVVQAYLKDAVDHILPDLADYSRRRNEAGGGSSIPVRLVKGAYWDYESIQSDQKRQELPVFPEKDMSDISYKHAVRKLNEHRQFLRSAFGSHNAFSLADAIATAQSSDMPMEAQMLYGMADDTKRALVREGIPLAVYCPIGNLLDGMAYLARRFLENASQQSFLRQRISGEADPARLLADPETDERRWPFSFPQPPDPTQPTSLDEPYRRATVIDYSRPENLERARKALEAYQAGLKIIPEAQERERADELPAQIPLLIGEKSIITPQKVVSRNPANPDQVVGVTSLAGIEEAKQAVEVSKGAFEAWSKMPVRQRAEILLKAAALMRKYADELIAVVQTENGKTLIQAEAEIGEAVDMFERYARDAVHIHEQNPDLLLNPKGVTADIAPWNFPLAIIAGMAAGPLAMGNTVILKPSRETPVIAHWLHRVCREAGMPKGVLTFLPADQAATNFLVDSPDVRQLNFTGSVDIGLSFYERAAPSGKGTVMEMGGKNFLIIDEDAHGDDVLTATLAAKFNDGGRKCSATDNWVFVGTQQAYEKAVKRLGGAIHSLRVGNPIDFGVSYGPMISRREKERLEQTIADIETYGQGRILYDGRRHQNMETGNGYFLGPTLVEITDPDVPIFREEYFGPILNVMRVDTLEEAVLLAQESKLGLTGGYVGRTPSRIQKVTELFRKVGNFYVNTDSGTVGAIVGEQNFGGVGLSGINGSKAGGQSYLWQFVDAVRKDGKFASEGYMDTFETMFEQTRRHMAEFTLNDPLHSPLGMENSMDYRGRGMGTIIWDGDHHSLGAVTGLMGAAFAAGNPFSVLIYPGHSSDSKWVPVLQSALELIRQKPLVPDLPITVEVATPQKLLETVKSETTRWVAFAGTQLNPALVKAATRKERQIQQGFVRSILAVHDPVSEFNKTFATMTEPRTVTINHARHGFDHRAAGQAAGKPFPRRSKARAAPKKQRASIIGNAARRALNAARARKGRLSAMRLSRGK